MGYDKNQKLKDLYEAKYVSFKEELDDKDNKSFRKTYQEWAKTFLEISRDCYSQIFVDAVCNMVVGIYSGISSKIEAMIGNSDEGISSITEVTHKKLDGVSNILAQRCKEFVMRINNNKEDCEYLFEHLHDYLTAADFLTELKEITLVAQKLAYRIDEAEKLSNSDDVYLADLKELENSPLTEIVGVIEQVDAVLSDWQYKENALCEKYDALPEFNKKAIFTDKTEKNCSKYKEGLSAALKRLEDKLNECKAKEQDIRQKDMEIIRKGWERMEARIPSCNEGYVKINVSKNGIDSEDVATENLPANIATLTLASIIEVAAKKNEKRMFSIAKLKEWGMITADTESVLVVDSGYDVEKPVLTDKDNDDLNGFVFSLNAYNKLIS